jgi:hypothetical protein
MNDSTCRRLKFLDQVLTRVIDQFEETFPECKALQPNGEGESSDEELHDIDEEVEHPPSPPNVNLLRRSSSMSEVARGLELEEGDVHRFRNLVDKRNLHGAEAELSGQELLEAILKVNQKTAEKENTDHMKTVLPRGIDVRGKDDFLVGARDRRDSDSHSI